MSTPLLEIRNLRTSFFLGNDVLHAIDGIDLRVERGETLGIVGESGSGKSATALSIINLVPKPGRIVAGEILYSGTNLPELSQREMRKVRGKEISLIFQEPMTSLDPLFTCGDQIAEALQLHNDISRKEAANRAVEMLRLVQIPDAERRAREYPHQMSGGMRQRVMIAIALACRPKLLIADEPTTALDVTIQAQILDLLAELKSTFGMAILLITHDMGVIAEATQRVVVMYAAKVVEEAPVADLFEFPKHPYTQGLLRSIPRITQKDDTRRRLETIPGVVPKLIGDLPSGCRFAARCPNAMKVCTEMDPPMVETAPGRRVACWLYG